MNSDQRPSDVTKKLTEQLDVDFALKAAGLGVWEVDPITNKVLWDDRCRELFGLAKDNELSYEQAIQSIHPDDVDRVNQAVQWAMNSQSDGHYDETYRTIGADDGKLRWIRCYGRGYFSETGEVYRFAGVTQEVTQQVVAQQGEAAARQEAQRQQRIYEAITASTPDLIYVFDLNYRFTYANQALLDMWGSTREQSIGTGLLENGYEPWHAQMHEREIDQVVATKQLIRGEVSFPHATLGKRVYDYVFAPVFNDKGEVEAVAGTTRDITGIKLAMQLKEEGQRQLLALFEQSPVGLATISADDDLVLQWANPFYGELVARPPQTIMGKPLLEALPEIKGQGFDEILKNVIATETPFIAREVALDILRDGQLTTTYIDLTYQPRKGVQGDVDSILVVATDVTQQVWSRREIEVSEQNLREMVMQAPIGICLLNASDLVAESVNNAFGQVVGKPCEAIMGKPYREYLAEIAVRHSDALDRVVQNGEAYHTNEAEINLIRQGKAETIYATFVYIPLRDGTGNVKKIAVWILENTYQVTERQKVEKQVRQRTEELASANEELAAMNIELISSNEDLQNSNQETVTANEKLAQSNYNLSRSNDSLEKFAYVASHDLQEPLRKIQQFSDILNTQYAAQLGEGAMYLERMQSAASRMSTLIRDLLTFSRISTQQNTASAVPLNKVIDTVLDDLELRIKETSAVVTVDPLPVVLGDRLQLQQLFQNLLSNALKFHRAGASPVIHVGYQKIPRNKLPASVKPGQSTSQYHQVDVTDNGVGFDVKYLDRIFQVFQRLHGRNEFAGTGIGLAICEKVVTNHGGAITASSQPGQGATFGIYLPA